MSPYWPGVRHWLLHLFRLQPCMNDCARIDGVTHHWVYCTICGRIAFSFTCPEASEEAPSR